jgi:hypothetical protein
LDFKFHSSEEGDEMRNQDKGMKSQIKEMTGKVLLVLLIQMFILAFNNGIECVLADGIWYIETVDGVGRVGDNCSIALDSEGNPHISYTEYDNILPAWYVKYASRQGGTWSTDTVECGGFNLGYSLTSLAMDSNNNPHICYEDYQANSLKYAYYDTDWHIETVDSDPGSWNMSTPSIALDSADKPHISYLAYDYDGNNDLWYAHKRGVADWQLEYVTSALLWSNATSIALDSDDKPHISYCYSYPSNDLKYAYYDGTWYIETADTAGGVGFYCSLALDSDNNPHISYYDGTNDDLKYAYFDGVSWNVETVDNYGDVGRYTSIALDSAGNPHISYYDGTNDDLKYAYCTPDGLLLTRSCNSGILLHRK